MADNIANQIARQLFAMASKKRDANLVESLHNERYQRTMTDEYDKWFPKIARAPLGPGTRWRAFVPPNAPQYKAMIERAKTADPKDFHLDERGIQVPIRWLKD